MEHTELLKKKISDETITLREEMRSGVLNYLSAALGFVVGLAWNTAISAFIKYFFPSAGNGIIANFVYAIVLTVSATLGIVYLGRILKKKDKDRESAS
jgi:hypothetical protein